MDNFTFGVTMAVVGVGGTMLSLWFLTLIINLMKRFLPAGESKDKIKVKEDLKKIKQRKKEAGS